MNTYALCALFLATLTQAKNLTKDRVKTACRSGNFESIKAIPCGDIKPKWFSDCLMNKDFKKDAALADVLKGCPALIPEKKKQFKKVARHLYTYNQLATLRVYLGDGRCKRLSTGLRNFFLKDAELNVAAICQQAAAPVGIIPGAAPTAPKTPAAAAAGTPAAPAAPVTPVDGSVKDWDEHRVNENKALLASLTREQAVDLGHTNNACLGLTAEHLSHAGVKPEVVASLSINCFRNIPAAAFSGLTKAQVAVITAWPYVRRNQIREIKPAVIVALPFDQLGIGCQTKKNVERHACFGVTSKQLKAIQKNKAAKNLYSKRCIRNSAPKIQPSFMHLSLAAAVALLLVL